MSSFVWIILVIIVYLLVIRPMFKNTVNKPVTDHKPKIKIKNKPGPSSKSSDKKDDDDYVDYEEVK